jgi:hypothetical protein
MTTIREMAWPVRSKCAAPATKTTPGKSHSVSNLRAARRHSSERRSVGNLQATYGREHSIPALSPTPSRSFTNRSASSSSSRSSRDRACLRYGVAAHSSYKGVEALLSDCIIQHRRGLRFGAKGKLRASSIWKEKLHAIIATSGAKIESRDHHCSSEILYFAKVLWS